jgi:hypothetical protein
MASAPKKSDPTLPIIIVLAALLLLILFAGNWNGFPRITWNGGGPDHAQNAGAPRGSDDRGGPDDRGGAVDRGDRRGPTGDRGFRRDRGCPGPGRDPCGIDDGRGRRGLDGRGRRGLDDRGRRGCGCERGRHRAGDRTDRRRDRGRDVGWGRQG